MGALRELFAEVCGERPMLVWCRTSYDDGEDDDDGRPRPEVRHAYVARGSALGDGFEFGMYPALCMPSNLGDPFYWLAAHPEMQHAPRCPYCLAVTVEIARRLVDRLGIVAEPTPTPSPRPSLLDRQLKGQVPEAGVPGGDRSVLRRRDGTGLDDAGAPRAEEGGADGGVRHAAA